jgi:hypothetical protein
MTDINSSLNKLKEILAQLHDGECASVSVINCPVEFTPTPTISLTPTVTPTLSLTPTTTSTPPNTPSITPTLSVTPTITATPTKSSCPNKWIVCQDYPDPILADSNNDCNCPTSTPTQTPSVTPTSTPIPTRTSTPAPTTSATVTPTITLTPSITPTITITSSVTQTITPSITPTITNSQTVTPSITSSETPSASPTPTITPSITPTLTITASNTPTISITPSISASAPAIKFNGVNSRGLASWNNQIGGITILGGNVTTIGSNGGPSAYDTYDQSGNAWEWTDGDWNGRKCIRGGSFESAANKLGSDSRGQGPVGLTNINDVLSYYIGFRIATINNPLQLANLSIIKNIMNEPDINTGYGNVNYEYSIGKYHITNARYAVFLNAIATTDTYNIYNDQMNSDPRCGITRSGSPGSYSYTVKTNMGNKPVVKVSWLAAARYCNWLSNNRPTGLQTATTTENGTYAIFGIIDHTKTSSVTKNTTNPNTGLSIGYWIPTENEWYKAAYYDPNRYGSNAGGYWKYATQSDVVPCSVSADVNGNGTTNCLITPTPTRTITPTPTTTTTVTPSITSTKAPATPTPTKTPTQTPTKPGPTVTPSVTPTITPTASIVSEFSMGISNIDNSYHNITATDYSLIINNKVKNTEYSFDKLDKTTLQYDHPISSHQVTSYVSKVFVSPINNSIGFYLTDNVVNVINLTTHKVIKTVTLDIPADTIRNFSNIVSFGSGYTNGYAFVVYGAAPVGTLTLTGALQRVGAWVYDLFSSDFHSFSSGSYSLIVSNIVDCGEIQNLSNLSITLYPDVYAENNMVFIPVTIGYKVGTSLDNLKETDKRVGFISSNGSFIPMNNNLKDSFGQPYTNAADASYRSYYVTLAQKIYLGETDSYDFDIRSTIKRISNALTFPISYILTDSNNNFIYSGQNEFIKIINISTRSLVGEIVLTGSGGGKITALKLSKNRNILYVAQYVTGVMSYIYVINTTTNSIITTYTSNYGTVYNIECSTNIFNGSNEDVFLSYSNIGGRSPEEIKLMDKDLNTNYKIDKLIYNTISGSITKDKHIESLSILSNTNLPDENIRNIQSFNRVHRSRTSGNCFIFNRSSWAVVDLQNSKITYQSAYPNDFDPMYISEQNSYTHPKTNRTYYFRYFYGLRQQIELISSKNTSDINYIMNGTTIRRIYSSTQMGGIITENIKAATLNSNSSKLYVLKANLDRPWNTIYTPFIEVYNNSNAKIETISIPYDIPYNLTPSSYYIEANYFGTKIILYQSDTKLIFSTKYSIYSFDLSTKLMTVLFDMKNIPNQSTSSTIDEIIINTTNTKIYVRSGSKIFIIDLRLQPPRVTQTISFPYLLTVMELNQYGNIFVLDAHGGFHLLRTLDATLSADSAVGIFPSYKILDFSCDTNTNLVYLIRNDNKIVGYNYAQ